MLEQFLKTTKIMSKENVSTIDLIVRHVTGLIEDLENKLNIPTTDLEKSFCHCWILQPKKRLLYYEAYADAVA